MSGRRRNVNIGANSIVYSGRGRPRTKEIVDRPLPVGIVLGSPSPGGDIFKNRKIRVGGHYQAKVPKAPLSSAKDGQEQQQRVYQRAVTRKPPSLVSQEYPHLTGKQVEEYQAKQQQQEENAQDAQGNNLQGPPSDMEVDTAATLTADAMPTTTTTTTTTVTSPHSSSSIASNNTSSGSTDRQSNHNIHNNDQETNSSMDAQSNNSNTNHHNNKEDQDTEENLKTQRGGLLVRPSATSAAFASSAESTTTTTTFTDDGEAFWDYIQPLLVPPKETFVVTANNNANDTWQSKILQWHLDKQQRAQEAIEEMQRKQQQEAEQQAMQPRRRGRRKRKKEDASSSTVKPETCQDALDCIMEEGKAHAMQHFWLRHKGQLGIAKVETRVQLSAGKAEMTRKVNDHKRRRDTPNHGGLYWRQFCEQSAVAAMTGDYRTSTNDTQKKGKKAMHQTLPADQGELEFHRETWKAILLLGQAIVEQLTKASSSSRVPPTKLSLLLSFLNNAYQVRPMPEDVFRAASVTPDINRSFDFIAEYADKARKVQAKLMDTLYETNDGGVEWDIVQKLLDQQGIRALPVELDDATELHQQLALVADWQSRLDALVEEDELCLSSLEDLAQEGRSFIFRSRSLVCLENRIQKAYQLRDRVLQWRQSCEQCEEDLDDKKENFKYLCGMVRDANRLKLKFPVVTDLLETHRTVEAWIDRANIAIRSRISLKEIKALVQKGEELPVNLSDLMEKLRSRVGLADDWISRFKDVVSCSDSMPDEICLDSGEALLRWMGSMRDALRDGKHIELHDLASEGSRIPVEIDLVKLLQIELDGKTWTMKAKKWVPCLAKDEDIACKKAKLEDLREHLEKGALLRERIDLPASEKIEWVLEGEMEIRAIVQAADDWFVKYKPYLDWDNRRSEVRSCLSMTTLRTICDEANAIHANIGNAAGKMARILAQAEDWQKKHETLLLTCKIIPSDQASFVPQDKSRVTLAMMTAASEAAASEVSLDLDEAKELMKLVEKVKDWTTRATNAAPKRSKRQSRGRKPKLTVDDIIGLIKEAERLPVDTSEEVNRLQIQLSTVQEWRAKAREELENIYNGFQKLRHVADETYGPPQEYTRKKQRPESTEGDADDTKSESDSDEKKSADDLVQAEMSSTAGSEDQEGIPSMGNGNCNINQLIKFYRREAMTHGVISGEVEAADLLEKVSNWCVRSVKYLVTQRDVFDKRFFGAFDRFVAQGRGLLAPTNRSGEGEQIRLEDQELAEKLNAAWSAVVSDQLQRLEVLLADREQFISWCNAAEAMLGSKGEKKPPLDKLKELTDQSRAFPSVCDMVQRVRGIFYKAMEWQKSTARILKEGPKMSRNEAKSILDEGEKLGFVCEEMKVIKNALRLARNWSNKVKRCDLDQGSTNATAVQALIEEHESLLLEMPEELATLQQAMKLYCICRRPYSGFMIGCDECEEWYHGLCIGITESKADRVDKFVCVRCCVSKVFKNTAKEGVAAVKKWTCQKDMKRARQTESQRHQRKIRKETKEIEKQRAQIQAIEESQQQQESIQTAAIAMEVENNVCAGVSNPLVLTNGVSTEATAAPQPTPPESDKTPENSSEQAEKPKPQPKLTPEEAQAKIQKCLDTIRKCNDRLSLLSKQTEEKKEIMAQEDAKASLLRNWFLRVRSLVLFPRSDEGAEQSRPLKDGSASFIMQSLIKNAQDLAIANLTDVAATINGFHCLSWCILASTTLARKPMYRDVELLVSLAKPLKFSEEKAIRVLRGILTRAKAWQAKVMKALAPSPGEKKKYNLETLKELELAAQDIPCHLKEVSLLNAVIEDKGARYCICGGPSDARVMLGCDKCARWFHGSCVNMTKEQSDDMQNWVCPPCSGSPLQVNIAKCGIVWDEVSDASSKKGKKSCCHLIASVAPDSAKMWPPFGLFGSSTALEMLGPEISAIPDAEELVPAAVVPVSAPTVNVPLATPAASVGSAVVQQAVANEAQLASNDQSTTVNQQALAPAPALSSSLPPARSDSAEAITAAPSVATTVKPCELPSFNWLAASGDLAAFAAAQASLGSWPMALGQAGAISSNSTAVGLDCLNAMIGQNVKPAASESLHNGNDAKEASATAATITTQEMCALKPQSAVPALSAVNVTKEQEVSFRQEPETLQAGAVKAAAESVPPSGSCHAEQAYAMPPAAETTVASEVQLPPAPAPMPPGLSLMVAALPLQEGGS
ncbi:Nucleosome-remodeling factor subunit [Seminavis robusta]|uniref:Nucleosome-remodeling factor subunit n=1 Tax=Seminavis robusta TaxID=568900 RepID=A0A9N8H095_9STRA|nr:Nucleosome-remodeling factor subunit [Seminavis robusta]|eukprot:Sro17_g012090.1 Nucleosome-remodeling factor subunit (2202) ;mRNA; r:20428-28023